MYEDANLPETDAWEALTRDLRAAKDARNEKERENEYVVLYPAQVLVLTFFYRKLKLELAEMKLLREQYVPCFANLDKWLTRVLRSLELLRQHKLAA